MRRVIEDAATALLRALCASFSRFDGGFRVEELISRGWASVTFSGARHRVVLLLEGQGAGAAADAFLEHMEEVDFDLADHILADIALVGEDRNLEADRVRLSLEALTVEDA
ncbi:MAG TPA: hypothetical protein VD887_06285 [Allosphingosinicella sp.]|nr:hypothetical protein [Allosphingosinicella sp.]